MAWEKTSKGWRLEIWSGRKGTAYLNHRDRDVSRLGHLGKPFDTVAKARAYLKKQGYTHLSG